MVEQIEDLKIVHQAYLVARCVLVVHSNITGLIDYVNRPQYSTVVGLLQYYHQNSDNDPVGSNYGDEANR